MPHKLVVTVAVKQRWDLLSWLTLSILKQQARRVTFSNIQLNVCSLDSERSSRETRAVLCCHMGGTLNVLLTRQQDLAQLSIEVACALGNRATVRYFLYPLGEGVEQGASGQLLRWQLSHDLSISEG